MRHIRIGAPDDVSVRPLIFGITRRQAQEAELLYQPSGLLADALARGELDAALISSIDYLRGVGGFFLDGPALVAKPSMGSLVLHARRPIEDIERIAVREYCGSPLSVARIVLAKVYGVTPDLCVRKNARVDWREEYDGILLTGDDGLGQLAERSDPEVEAHDIASMWYDLTSLPLVLGLWVYNDEALKGQLIKVMVLSRNLGVRNLSCLADGIASTTKYNGELVYDYLSNCWDYQLSDAEMEGLKAYEEFALEYDLIRRPRLAGISAM